MRETSSRMVFVGVSAWMSACLLITSWLPEMTESFRYLWMLSGLTGLVASVGLAEVVKVDIRRQELLLREYMTAAFTDGLTGLGNRQSFDKILSRALEDKERHGDPVTVLMIDADHFKAINDTFGHQAGDQVLIKLASGANHFFSRLGAVARYGGEEFTVALFGCRLKQGVQLANDFREVLLHQPTVYKDQRIPCTVSIGVASAHPGERPDDLLRRADSALYSAKQMGRNCVWFAEGQSDTAVSLALELVTRPA